MKESKRNSFDRQCRLSMSTALLEFGYAYSETYVRPRGVAIEFIHGMKRCFISCEGETVFMDVILPCPGGDFCRVSVNQALWFGGVKAISHSASIGEQLSLLATELKRHCRVILSGDLSTCDPRFCFMMSEKECADYIAYQTGKC